jgi:hypothetical protein
MILISGTISNAVQLQTLNNKWQQKKESGDVLSKEERNERANWTQEDWLKHDLEEQAAQNRESSKKTELDNKILAGGSLTPEEEKYLEQNDPAKLQKYKEIQAEKKAYEEKLKRCKTKDEVQRLKTQTMGEYLASMKKTENDPYIPKSAKLAKAQELLAKTRNAQKVEMKFMQSLEYQKLPTEEEKAEERSKERELDEEQNVENLEKAVDNNEEMIEEAAADGNKGADEDIAVRNGTDESVVIHNEDESAAAGNSTSEGAAISSNADESAASGNDRNESAVIMNEADKGAAAVNDTDKVAAVIHKKAESEDFDSLREMEEMYYRIRLNVQFDNDGNTDIRTDSERKVGGKINITA